MVNPKKLETGLRTISAGIPYTLLLRVSNFLGFTISPQREREGKAPRSGWVLRPRALHLREHSPCGSDFELGAESP